ncbi:MAG: hypothetical protein ABIR30_13560 [Chitinophagaceae bacterium]
MSSTWLLENTWKTPGILAALLRYVKKQHRFIREHLQPELDTAKALNDGSLHTTDFKKITQYYGLAVPAILGEELCALRGSEMSLQERLALTYQGAMTGLGDDFFDKQIPSPEKMMAFLETPEKFTGHTANERLFLDFYKKALEYAHDPELVKYYLRKVLAAQIESKKQAVPGLSQKEILDITIDKGGWSVLFYRAAMSHPLLQGEEEALYKMGGLMQFGNDVYGIYDDRNEDIHTLLTTSTKISETREIFRSVMNESFQVAYQAGYPVKNTKKFLRLVSMSLCSRCFVCFDQLEKKEAETGGVFSPKQYSRADLVCDMDKTRNKWRSVNWHIRHNIHPTGTSKEKVS